MPAPATADALLDLIRKSGVIDAGRLDSAIRSAGKLPDAPKPLADQLARDGVLTSFQASQLLLGRWKGFRLGEYIVLSLSGVSSNAGNYVCRRETDGTLVTLRVLSAEVATSDDVVEMFRRRCRAHSGLSHPHVVRGYEVGEAEGLHYHVREFVDGTTLQGLAERVGPLDPARAAQYAAAAIAGLGHAHDAGLVHRNVRPRSLLLDRQGIVKVAGFDLALLPDSATISDADGVVGTADYLAPEQALDSHSVDRRADFYALGATLYFLLTGSPPFSEGTVAQKLIWHQTRQPRPLKALRPEVPGALAGVVEAMLAKDPASRPQSADAVRSALSPWLDPPASLPTEVEIPPLEAAFRAISMAVPDRSADAVRLLRRVAEAVRDRTSAGGLLEHALAEVARAAMVPDVQPAALAGLPAGSAVATAEAVARDWPEVDRQRLAGWLGCVSRNARQASGGDGDSVGDLLTLLPPRLPRFKPGDRPTPGGSWELVELLGVGGFGEVWMARHADLDSMPPRALKFCLDPDARDRLLRHEAAVINRVMRYAAHPGTSSSRATCAAAWGRTMPTTCANWGWGTRRCGYRARAWPATRNGGRRTPPNCPIVSPTSPTTPAATADRPCQSGHRPRRWPAKVTPAPDTHWPLLQPLLPVR